MGRHCQTANAWPCEQASEVTGTFQTEDCLQRQMLHGAELNVGRG